MTTKKTKTTAETQTTTDEMNEEFPSGMKQELGFYIRSAAKRYDDARCKLIATAQTNPISAITWDAEAMVKAQAQHEMYMCLERGMAKADPRKVLLELADEVDYRIRSFFGSNSTSMFSNAVERAKADAYVHLLDEIKGLMKHFGI
ncbi:MAG: hypothetical protein ACE15C_20825 [Phycisphaerae bacterium]